MARRRFGFVLLLGALGLVGCGGSELAVITDDEDLEGDDSSLAVPGTEGFVSLVSESSDGSSVAAQAARGYRRLLPRLVAARETGAINGYAPNFAAGVVTVWFNDEGSASAALGNALTTTRPARTTERAVQAFRGTSAATAGGEATVEKESWIFVVTGDAYVFFLRPPFAGKQVRAELLNKYGTMVASGRTQLDAEGLSEIRLANGAGRSVAARPGWTLRVKVFDSPGQVHATYSKRIPNITFRAANGEEALLSGTGGPGRFEAYWYRPPLNDGQEGPFVSVHGVVSPSLTWEADFGETPFLGGDVLGVAMYDQNFAFDRSFQYSMVGVVQSREERHGTVATKGLLVALGMPGDPVTLSVYRTSGVSSGSMELRNVRVFSQQGLLDYWGGLSANFPGLQTGDRVELTASIPRELVVPQASVELSSANLTVRGLAPAANEHVFVYASDLSYTEFCDGYPLADARRGYSMDCSSSPGLFVPGIGVETLLGYVFPSSGNMYYRSNLSKP